MESEDSRKIYFFCFVFFFLGGLLNSTKKNYRLLPGLVDKRDEGSLLRHQHRRG
jgi:hypothetical protein